MTGEVAIHVESAEDLELVLAYRDAEGELQEIAERQPPVTGRLVPGGELP